MITSSLSCCIKILVCICIMSIAGSVFSRNKVKAKDLFEFGCVVGCISLVLWFFVSIIN